MMSHENREYTFQKWLGPVLHVQIRPKTKIEVLTFIAPIGLLSRQLAEIYQTIIHPYVMHVRGSYSPYRKKDEKLTNKTFASFLIFSFPVDYSLKLGMVVRSLRCLDTFFLDHTKHFQSAFTQPALNYTSNWIEVWYMHTNNREFQQKV